VQIRLVGDQETVKALVERMNAAQVPGVRVALGNPRKGRKGEEYLSYGTVALDAMS
jgi:hypothetical protein